MSKWKAVPSTSAGYKNIVGQVPTEWGLAHITIARHVPNVLASFVVEMPEMVALLRDLVGDSPRRTFEDVVRRHKGIEDRARVILDRIDGKTEPEGATK